MPGAIARPSKKGGSPDPQEDAFIEAVERLIAWGQQNLQAVIGGAVLVVVLLLAGLWYWNYQESRTQQAERQLQSIRSAIATGADTVGIPRLQGFVSNFGGTEAGREGRVLLARLQLDRNDAEAAMETIEPVVDAVPADEPTGVAARRVLGEAQEAAGRSEAALRTYQELARDARFTFQRNAASAERAAILVEMGRLEEAREIYERLVEESSEADTEQMYAVRLGEVQAMMDGAGSSDAGSSDPASAESGSS